MSIVLHQPRKGTINRRTISGWRSWVVPASLLSQFILDHRDVLNELYAPLQDSRGWTQNALKEDGGWREALCLRMCGTLGLQLEAVRRRLYDVTYGKTKTINVSFAEAVCIAVGKTLDHDTDIPTLPGSIGNAKELIRCKAAHHGIELDESEVQELAHRTIRVAKLIVAYPHNAARLIPLAPLDAFRPYR